MRYDDQRYVEQWQETGRYPKIHEHMFDAVVDWIPTDGVLLDLCCSTGLLGRHLAAAGYRVVWQDGDERALRRAVRAGVLPDGAWWARKLDQRSWGLLIDWMVEAGVDTVLARRAFPELSETVPLDVVRNRFAEAGVRNIVLEGRKVSNRSCHPYLNADREVGAMAPAYRQVAHRGAVRHLVH